MATQVTQENRQAVVSFLKNTLQTILVGQTVPDDQVDQLEARIFAQHGDNQEQYLQKVEQKIQGVRRKMQQQPRPQPQQLQQAPVNQGGQPAWQQHQQQALQARQHQQQPELQARTQQTLQARQQQSLQAQHQQQQRLSPLLQLQQQQNMPSPAISQRARAIPHIQQIPPNQHSLLRAQQNPQLSPQQQQQVSQRHIPRQLHQQPLPSQQRPLTQPSQSLHQQLPFVNSEEEDFSDMAQAFILSHHAQTSATLAPTATAALSLPPLAAPPPPALSLPMPTKQGYLSASEVSSATSRQFWQLQATMRATHLEDLAYVSILLQQFKLRQPTAANQVAMLQQLVDGTPLLRVARGNPKHEAAACESGPRGLLSRLTSLQGLMATVMPRLRNTLEAMKAAHKRKQAALSGQSVPGHAPPSFNAQKSNPGTQQLVAVGTQAAVGQGAQLPMVSQPAASRDQDALDARSAGSSTMAHSPLPPSSPVNHFISHASVSSSQALLGAIGRCEQLQMAAVAPELRNSLLRSDNAMLNPAPPPDAWMAAMKNTVGGGGSGTTSGFVNVGANSSNGSSSHSLGYCSGGSSSCGSPTIIVSRPVNEIQGTTQSATSANIGILGVKRKANCNGEAMSTLKATIVKECQVVQAGSSDNLRFQISQDGEDWLIRCTPGNTLSHDANDTVATKAPGFALKQRPPSPQAQSMVVRVRGDFPFTPLQAEFPETLSARENKAVEELQTWLAASDETAWTVSGLTRKWGDVILRQAGNSGP